MFLSVCSYHICLPDCLSAILSLSLSLSLSHLSLSLSLSLFLSLSCLFNELDAFVFQIPFNTITIIAVFLLV